MSAQSFSNTVFAAFRHSSLQAIAGEAAPPPRACSSGRCGGKFASCVPDGVQLHRHKRVEYLTLAIRNERLNVQPEVAMELPAEGARAAALQLHIFDSGHVFADESVVSAAFVALKVPGEQSAVAQAVLRRLELGGEIRVYECSVAVGLGGVIASSRSRSASAFSRWFPHSSPVTGSCRVIHSRKPPRRAVITTDPSTRDDESGDVRLGCVCVHLESLGATRLRSVCVAGSPQRADDRPPDTAGVDAALASFHTRA